MIRSEPDRLELLVDAPEVSKLEWMFRWIGGDAALICPCLTHWLVVSFVLANLRLV